VPSQHRREPLSRSEAQQLVRAAEDARERCILRVLLDTGLRASEFNRITPDDFNYDMGVLTVRGSGHQFRRGVRYVSVADPATRSALENLLGTGGTRVSPRTLQRMVARIARAAGIRPKVSPETIRRTFLEESQSKW
jgi:integrase/recombinase XerD